jgi:hypothetical protein
MSSNEPTAADKLYEQRIRNLEPARRIELENLPGNHDLGLLNEFDRDLVELFRQTTQWKMGVRTNQGNFHCPA